MTPRMRLLNILAGIFVILGVAIYSVNIYSSYFETPFLSYKNLPFPVTPDVVSAGEQISFMVVRCNSSNDVQQLVSTRALVPEDSIMKAIIFDYIFVNVAPGCTPPTPLTATIPLGTAPGFYRVAGKSKVKGLAADHEVSWNTALIQVVTSQDQRNSK